MAAARALGVGDGAAPGAAVRYWHSRSPEVYVAATTTGRLPVAGAETVSDAQHEEERLMLGLRLRAGVRISSLQHAAAAAELASAGLLDWDGAVARATPQGLAVLNQVVLRMVDPPDRRRCAVVGDDLWVRTAFHPQPRWWRELIGHRSFAGLSGSPCDPARLAGCAERLSTNRRPRPSSQLS